MKSSQIFNFKHQFLGLCVLAFVLTFNSCKKDEKANDIAESSNSTAVLNYIKSLGYTDLQIKNMGDEYLVDGDISFPKDMVIPKNISNPKDIKTKQWGTGSYVTSTDVVYVTIDPSMSAYTSQITAAFAQWNSVCSSRIHFAIYNSQIPTTHILIRTASDIPGAYAVARFPFNALPGSLIRINSGLFSGLSTAKKQAVIIHELGHCVGFRHTNWQGAENQNGADDLGHPAGAVLVPGTPQTDASSIMNIEVGYNSINNIDGNDMRAMYTLYPKPALFNTTVTVNNTNGVSWWITLTPSDCRLSPVSFNASPGITTYTVSTQTDVRYSVKFDYGNQPAVFRVGYSSSGGTTATFNDKYFMSGSSDSNMYIYPGY